MSKRTARRRDPNAARHEAWLGAVQPEGLVFSIPVLAEKVTLARQPADTQLRLRALCPDARLADLDAFFEVARAVLGWPKARVIRDDQLADRWRLDVPSVGVTLSPDAALIDAQQAPLLFVQWTPDDPDEPPDDGWSASPQQRLERLLVELQRPADDGPPGPPIGVHVFPDGVRLVYAPAGGAAGYLTFPVEALVTADGRDLLDAFVATLGKGRLMVGADADRLPALLAESRSRQAEVTTALAAQVEQALRALLAGFDAANARSDGKLLLDLKEKDGRRHLYEGLVTSLLRLLFVLFAEDRDLLPMDRALYREHYSLATLAERLDHDALVQGPAMDRRFGAWARVLATFRLVFAGSDALAMPARHGQLFDPDAYPFLEGRTWQGRDDSGSGRWQREPANVPAVDDATVHQVLSSLVHLQGQRLSYANLSEEELGSMYEALMGFELCWAGSPALPLQGGVTVELGPLRDAADPVEYLRGELGLKRADVVGKAPDLADFRRTDAIRADFDALRAALGPLRAREGVEVPPEGHYLQPSEERRHSGSHYTPRELTQSIVRDTLQPLLWAPEAADAPPPSPDRILGLRVCDPAMGSGAFLVQVVRFLGQALSEAWAREGSTPAEAGDRADLYARRLVAEQCVYGVDKNPLAVRLAKLSLWLVTLARDLPFTFVDHALREGDALVGVSRSDCRNWRLPPKPPASLPLAQGSDFVALGDATSLRDKALKVVSRYDEKAQLVRLADAGAEDFRAAGDVIVAIYENEKTKKARDAALDTFKALDLHSAQGKAPATDPATKRWRDELKERPFHWQVEFPEVFARPDGGFDAVVGNPPFGGKNTILAASGDHYIKLLQALRPHAHGNADLSAHFFLRAAEVLRPGGHFGLIATNTISQGDTRDTGLKWLVHRGVSLYRARADVKWQAPGGGAAVTVSVVHGRRGAWTGERWLDGAPAVHLNSALDADQEWDDPQPLAANRGKAFQGSIVLGMGFVLTPEERDAMLAADPRNAEVIQPYLGGRELNSRPDLRHERYVINFRDWPVKKAATYAAPFERVERLVKPERATNKRAIRKERWWQFAERAPALYAALEKLDHCIVCSRVSKHLLWAVMPARIVFNEKVVVLVDDDLGVFGCLQSVVHSLWAWELSSTLESRLQYTPSRCFETFPFPDSVDTILSSAEAFEAARRAYLLAHDVGLTQATNRLTDPHDDHFHDDDVGHLRALRDALDAAVLDAYGWSDIDGGDTKTIVQRLRGLNAARHAAARRATKAKS